MKGRLGLGEAVKGRLGLGKAVKELVVEKSDGWTRQSSGEHSTPNLRPVQWRHEELPPPELLRVRVSVCLSQGGGRGGD